MLALRRLLLLHVLLPTARGAPPTTFHAANGSHLYRGCAPPSHARDAYRHLSLPDYIVIGAQKGGTETLSYELRALSLDGRRLCHARAEVHFFSSHHFMLHQITDVDLQQYAHTLEKLVPRGCLNATDRRLSLLGEKSPGYSYVSYAALRMCEALVSPRIFFLLRNPVTRAYSAFHHTRSDVRWMFPNISFDPDGFNRLVDVETAIVQGCQASIVPSGDPRAWMPFSPPSFVTAARQSLVRGLDCPLGTAAGTTRTIDGPPCTGTHAGLGCEWAYMSGKSAFYFNIIALAACSLPYRRTFLVTTIKSSRSF